MSTTTFTKHLPPRTRLIGAIAASVTALGAATAISLTASANAASVQTTTLSPFAVSAAGASVAGMTEYEAENANTNGTKIGPDYTQGVLATEASGRQAVQLRARASSSSSR